MPRLDPSLRRPVGLFVGFLVLTALLSPVTGDTVVAIVATALVLNVVVVIHEFCHMVAALMLGIDVLEFGMGFPPRARFIGKFRGVPVSLNWLPLGGFVKLHGESSDAGERSFTGAGLGRQLLVILAGPVSNIVFGFLIILVLVATKSGNALVDAPGIAFDSVMTIMYLTIEGIVSIPAMLLSNPLNPPVTGLPGIVAIGNSFIEQGPRYIFAFAAMLSLSVGVFNLVPMVPLDGGRAVVLVIRRILGSRYPERLGRVLTYAGVGALLGVLVIANVADLFHLLFGGGVFEALANR